MSTVSHPEPSLTFDVIQSGPAAASTWNAVPRPVRSSTSVLQFSSRLKTEL